MNVPKLIVVTGRPGAGKTTLAHALAREMRCPAFCRDEFKEGLVQTLSHATSNNHAQINLVVYDTFFQAIELLLRNHITLIAEAAFQHKLWMPKLQPLQAIADIRLVVCSVDPALARTRYLERSIVDPAREHYHPHTSIQPNEQDSEVITPYQPPQLAAPTLHVDTSNGYNPSLQQIVEFATQATGGPFRG